MANDSPRMLVAVDVGNTKIHFGVFDCAPESLPRPRQTLQLHARDAALEPLSDWIRTHAGDCSDWAMTCVNAPSGQRVESHLAAHLPQVHLAKLTCADVPLKIEVDFPQLVGIDRLMAAVGACALRDGKRPLIVICAGTAITVNLVSAAGAFQGGAILPGMAMASQILQRYTDKLPWIDTQYLHGPSPVGKNTEAALASGIYWGTVGALRSLIDKMSAALDGDPQIFITGGDAPQIASQLPAVEHVEDLVLSGIALTVRSHRQSAPGQGAT